MRRRKSSCPNIEPRRTSATPNRNTVKLDLYIEDDELHPVPGGGPRRNSPSPTQNDHHHSSSSSRRRSSTNIEDTAEEVLCLRLLSTRTRYRFGGLRVNLISPVFNVDKLFNVEFDQDSQISLIKSQQSSFDQTTLDSPTKSFFKDIPKPDSRSFMPTNKKDIGKCATIVIEPESEDQKDEITRQLPLLTADLTLLEESDKSTTPAKSHVTARSLTRIPEPESEQHSSIVHWRQRHQSATSSINSTNNGSNNFNSSTNDYYSGAGGSIVKFDNVKVYRQIQSTDDDDDDNNRQSMIETFNLDTIAAAAAAVSASTKELSACKTSASATASPAKSPSKKEQKKSTKSKIKEMRRHTHFYCHIPTSLLQNYGGGSSSSGSSNNSKRDTGPT